MADFCRVFIERECILEGVRFDMSPCHLVAGKDGKCDIHKNIEISKDYEVVFVLNIVDKLVRDAENADSTEEHNKIVDILFTFFHFRKAFLRENAVVAESLKEKLVGLNREMKILDIDLNYHCNVLFDKNLEELQKKK